jgi:hypothetical protein
MKMLRMRGFANKAFEGAITHKGFVGGLGANMNVIINDESTLATLDSNCCRAETISWAELFERLC